MQPLARANPPEEERLERTGRAVGPGLENSGIIPVAMAQQLFGADAAGAERLDDDVGRRQQSERGFVLRPFRARRETFRLCELFGGSWKPSCSARRPTTS